MALRTASCFPPPFTLWSPTEHEVGAVRLSPALETRGGYRLKRGRTPRHLLSSCADNGPKLLLGSPGPSPYTMGTISTQGPFMAVMQSCGESWQRTESVTTFPPFPVPLKGRDGCGLSWVLVTQYSSYPDGAQIIALGAVLHLTFGGAILWSLNSAKMSLLGRKPKPAFPKLFAGDFRNGFI